MENDANVVLCGANSYEQKYYLSQRFQNLPQSIQDELKMFYYRGLKEWNHEKGYLTDTCLTAQDKYKTYLDYFRISYEP